MITAILGILILTNIILVLWGHYQKSDRILKFGITLTLLLTSLLFIYCHTQFPVQDSVLGRQREMTAISLFFAVLIAIVWRF